MTLDAEAQALLDDVRRRVPDAPRPKYQDDWRQPTKTARPTSSIKEAKRIIDDVMQRYGKQMSGSAQFGAGKRYSTACGCRYCRFLRARRA